MIKYIGIDNVKKFIHNLPDIGLLFYIDEFTQLLKSDDVKNSILSCDMSTFLQLAYEECVERFRVHVSDKVGENDRV